MNWAVEELQGLDLGDERLNKRTYQLVGDFFANASQHPGLLRRLGRNASGLPLFRQWPG
ncbi:MAG: hypothetical protein HZT40_03180 [Candidatus Thiothrix singaporensis]|uniref:Transposase Tn5-like N-terminal domain-containing protein n=1 Tax=Candidatus Thiothrix singaporensis TaxID=2799669 RepID=A0A7L6ANU7_9GAMM|nr:MAG: hypothetical protein HZT40_03180 [Candidatus Thiothrix singaporensis]